MRFAWYLEVCSISFALLILIIHRILTNSKEYRDRLYLYACLYTIIMAFGDMYWIMVDLDYFNSHVVGHQYAANIIWNLGMDFAAFFWFLFCETLYSRKWAAHKRFIFVSMLPALINVIVTVSSVKTGWLFVITEDGDYSRGPYMYVSMAICFGYLIYPSLDGLAVFLKEKSYRKRKYISATLFFPLVPVAAGIIQAIYPQVPLITIGCTYSLLVSHTQLRTNDVETDALTGVKNKNGLMYWLENEIYNLKYSDDYTAKQLGLIIVDINGLAGINNEFGRKEGDKTLVMVKELIEEACRDYNCTIARFRGDQLAVATGINFNSELSNIENNIELKLSEHNNQPNLRYLISITTGHAVYTADMKGNPVSLLGAAEEDLETNKDYERQHIRRGGIA